MRETRSKTMSRLPYTGAVSCPVTPTPQSDAAAASAGAKAAAATTKSRAIPRPRPPRLAVGGERAHWACGGKGEVATVLGRQEHC